MGNLALYLSTILIWGTSFYAIGLQLTHVAPEVSIFYRFSLAAMILFIYCVARNKPMRYSIATHLRFAGMGFFLFNLNFLLVYFSSRHMPTGLVSVVFSTVVIFNMVNGAVFLKDRLSPLMIAGALTGIAGIALVFYPEIREFDLSDSGLLGLALALMGTISASIGMIISAKNQRDRLPVIQTNAWGMLYGAALMLISIWIQGIPFTFDSSAAYIGSLIYLALFASVLAFGCFLTLIGRIGAGKASYASVLFPILALAISTWLEGYHLTGIALIGALLALLGNALILLDKQK